MLDPKSEQEMLRLAALEAGYEVRWHENWQCYVHINPYNITNPPTPAGQRMVWAPLDDDGDAARLEADAGLDVAWGLYCVVVRHNGNEALTTESISAHDGDKHKARRYASVKAAYILGKRHHGQT